MARQAESNARCMCRGKNLHLLSPRLSSSGKGSRIYRPLLLVNLRFVSLGQNSSIRPGARIEAIVLDEKRPPAIKMGDNINIEQNVHIVCTSRIVIGNSVSITGNCAIVDKNHPFDLIDDYPIKIGARIDPSLTPVSIGSNTFVGYGTVILPSVKIGVNCVIPANSTVTKDVPDFCVAAGNPARVMRRYDPERQKWVCVD